MKFGKTTAEQILRHLRALQQLTWVQTVLLGLAGIGFLRPDTGADVHISLPNGILSYPDWLLGMAGLSTLYVIPALWWSFKRLDMHEFSRSRWVNWHVAVLTVFMLFVFICGPYDPGTAMFVALAEVLYGVVSANVISRYSQRLSQDNANNQEAVMRDVPETRDERLILAEQELRALDNKAEVWRSQIWGNSKCAYYVMGLPVAFPLLVSWFLPLHLMHYWLWLRAYVGWMAAIVPAVAKFRAMTNPYGQLAATVNALMWPGVLGAILYWWLHALIPLFRTPKAICMSYYNARLEASTKRIEVQTILKQNSVPLPSSWTAVNISFLCVSLWILLSDLDFLPTGIPAVGPIAGNGLFIYATVNRFYLSLISGMAVLTAMIAYAYVPAHLIGQLIFRLKPDSTNNDAPPLA